MSLFLKVNTVLYLKLDRSALPGRSELIAPNSFRQA